MLLLSGLFAQSPLRWPPVHRDRRLSCIGRTRLPAGGGRGFVLLLQPRPPAIPARSRAEALARSTRQRASERTSQRTRQWTSQRWRRLSLAVGISTRASSRSCRRVCPTWRTCRPTIFQNSSTPWPRAGRRTARRSRPSRRRSPLGATNSAPAGWPKSSGPSGTSTWGAPRHGKRGCCGPCPGRSPRRPRISTRRPSPMSSGPWRGWVRTPTTWTRCCSLRCAATRGPG
mmetsp:Transcript_50735/g.164065  ORF Transcript_50735/g.164065 Transcript_50735/m.164065 type:complete len:229 (+) Transcript_50735:176-862(+)